MVVKCMRQATYKYLGLVAMWISFQSMMKMGLISILFMMIPSLKTLKEMEEKDLWVPAKVSLSVHGLGMQHMIPLTGLGKKPTITHYLSIVPLEFSFEHISIFEASESDYYADEAEGDDPMKFYGDPVLEDSLGDRVVDIRINNPGIFSTLQPQFPQPLILTEHIDLISIDGSPDFVDAEIEISTTLGISEFLLDENGTFLETLMWIMTVMMTRGGEACI